MDIFGGMIFLIVAVVVGFCVYFLPSFLGWNKRNSGAIIALNLLLGWTAIGWIIALIWALTNDAPAQVIVHTLPPVNPGALFCARCGKYSPPASRFCQHCGQTI